MNGQLANNSSLPVLGWAPVCLADLIMLSSLGCVANWTMPTAVSAEKPPDHKAAERSDRHQPGNGQKSPDVIALRTVEIDRLLKGLNRVGTIDPNPGFDMQLPEGFVNDAAVRSLVKLQAIEAVPSLCERITALGGTGGGRRPGVNLPAAEALMDLGGSAIPGIYESLEKSIKTDKEIKVFAFVLCSIDHGDQELTSFRLERERKRRTAELERNATFRENELKLRKCFATPDYFRPENNPFYGH